MHWGFVIGGYLVTFAGLAAYVAAVLHRGRALSRQVPEERRRFLD